MIPPVIPKQAPLEFNVDGNYRFRLIAFVIHQLLEKIAPESNWRGSLFALFNGNKDFPGIEMGFDSNWRRDPFWDM